ncbi:MAG: hypothetical protein ABJC63_02025 [Gemmatimonadales bacterium]
MRKMLVVVFAALSMACSDGIVGSSTVFGKYTLRTVNGSILPYTVSTIGTTKTEILGDTINFYEGFTYAEAKTTRITVSGTATSSTHVETGSFSLMGNSVFLRGNDGGPLQNAPIEADVMTFIYNGLTSVFKKTK